ncbi:MAG: hypothetical protein CFE22_05095 [Cytophagaceae bacterium BCCC1]|nr:MAG: hypothetical protein CFE22_05095 [Cytophagaceae bacterium BCCC1]
MAKLEKSERICIRGHKYFKSSDCLVCPICENVRKSQESFLSKVSAPVQRALENKGITDLEEFSHWSKKDLLNLHGIGLAAIPVLEGELIGSGLKFK